MDLYRHIPNTIFTQSSVVVQCILQPRAGFAQGIGKVQELLKATVRGDHYQLTVKHRESNIELVQALR